jgi:hypothetical protein
MKRFAIFLALGVLAFGVRGANAATIIGDLNNFDTLNDTGQVCYGFEIEIDGVRSADITYTFDWNHYGAPKIREDTSDPSNPRVFVRYESAKDAAGNWGANGSFTNPAIPTVTPPAGHSCTDPTVNEGCEHFGVGYYGTPTALKYTWLIDGGAAGLVYFGSPVAIAAPTFAYTPPPAPGQLGAQVVAAIPAPVLPIPAGKQFGEPSWVKVIKTTTHNANPVALQDLISDDADNDGMADWQNNEPDQVETEWFLLQTNNGANPVKAELGGAADDMGDGSETVTRRYEFYRYGAALDTIDGETGEAMCDEVNPTTDPADPSYLHGLRDNVAVTDADGNTYYVNCAAQVVVGNYVGAQMAGFAAAAPLGLIDHLQDGESGTPYTPRTVVVGGNSPFTITIPHGSLPPGLTFDSETGVLSGTPTAGGDFPFSVQATDADNTSASQTYSLHVAGLPAPQFDLVVAKQGGGTGTVAGSGIDCGLNCSTHLDAGTAVTLSAAVAAGSVFTGWSGPCTGAQDCTFTLNASTTVYATFVPASQQFTLTVTNAGNGTVTSSPKGINCGKHCSKAFTAGTSVTLTAKTTRKHGFVEWTGACSGTLPTCIVPMLSDLSVGAVFN